MVAVCSRFSAVTGRLITPRGCTASLEDPLNGVGVGRNLLGSMPIVAKASQKRISDELPLSIKIILVVLLVTNNVITNTSSCRYRTPSQSSFPNEMLSKFSPWLLGQSIRHVYFLVSRPATVNFSAGCKGPSSIKPSCYCLDFAHGFLVLIWVLARSILILFSSWSLPFWAPALSGISISLYSLPRHLFHGL